MGARVELDGRLVTGSRCSRYSSPEIVILTGMNFPLNDCRPRSFGERSATYTSTRLPYSSPARLRLVHPTCAAYMLGIYTIPDVTTTRTTKWAWGPGHERTSEGDSGRRSESCTRVQGTPRFPEYFSRGSEGLSQIERTKS